MGSRSSVPVSESGAYVLMVRSEGEVLGREAGNFHSVREARRWIRLNFDALVGHEFRLYRIRRSVVLEEG